MTNIKFSIIVPAYNAEKYISACLDSCINQEPYILGKDFEVICINDGSEDSTLDLLSKYQAHGVTVVNQKNQGVSAARNNGMGMAIGEYLWFVDSDDLIQASVLPYLYDVLKSHNADGCAFRIKAVPETYTVCNAIPVELKISEHIPNMQNAAALIIKRDYVKRHSICFNTAMAYGEDTLFVFYLRLYKHNFVYFDSELYFYRQVLVSAMHQTSVAAKEKMLSSQLQMLNEFKRVLDNWNEEYNYGDAKPQERYYWTVQNILFSILKLENSRKHEMFEQLKLNRHYPYPILWRRLFRNSNSITAFLINAFCLLFPMEWYYRLMMKLVK